MAIQLTIEYEALLEIVDQLSEEQQQQLIEQIMEQRARRRALNAEEKIQLLESAQLHNSINEIPSIRRADWYDDHGR